MLSSLSNPIDNLPYYLLIDILSNLDLKSILSCTKVCKAFNSIIEDKLWKTMSIRDYSNFLCTIPLSPQELGLPRTSDIQTKLESKEEADRTIIDPSKQPLSETEKGLLEENINHISNWKEFYLKCYRLPKLGGYWAGDYGGHGYELIRVYQKGYQLYAKKLTGDPNVPAGKLTWRMILSPDLKTGRGEIHLADTGFENSRWSTAVLELTNINYIEVTWFPYPNIGLVFGNTRAGFEGIETGGSRQLIYLED